MNRNLNILSIMASLIKYVEVDEIENFPKVKVKTVEEFLKAVKSLGRHVIYKYEDNIEQMFFYVDEGVIFYIPSNGFKTLPDLINAKNLGLTAGEYYEYLEFRDIDEYKKYKTSGFKTIEDYKKAKELGFIGGLENLVKEKIAVKTKDNKYRISYLSYGILEEREFKNDAELYYFALKSGFNSFDMLVNALKLGFGDAKEYQDAIKRGFRDAYEYDDALSKGFKDAEEYKMAKSIGISSEKELKEYMELKRICENFNLETFEEGYLLKILMNMNLDETINIKDLFDKLKEKEKLMKIKKDILNKLTNISSPSWYSTRFNTIDDLEEYLNNSEVISLLGEYIKDKKVFKRVYPPKPSKRIVIIDIMSILEYVPNLSSKTIENLIKKIINAEFRNVIVIMDKSTYYKIKGKDIFNYLVKECKIKMVESKEESYNLIIDYIKNFGALVISNDSFKDCITNDSKYHIYKEIKDYIVPFTIENEEIKVDIELLRKLYTELVTKRLKKIKENVIL